MKKLSLKSILGILGPAMLVVGVAIDSGSFDFANLALRLSRALDYNITLDHDNAPTLTGGVGTMIDEKNITWEYNDCASDASGHVKVNNGGYFGISSSSIYGYTGIDALTASFTGNELWLFTSVNGANWIETDKLESGRSTTVANNWHYVRFYSKGGQTSVTSVSIDYRCEGDSAIEDSDGAKASNIVDATSNLTITDEYSELSPSGKPTTRAVRLEKSGSASSSFTINFAYPYIARDIAERKIEFDIKGNANFNRTILLMSGSEQIGSKLETNTRSELYRWTNIADNWWHVEAPITYFYTLISGYKKQDLPTIDPSIEITGITLNSGTCIIDNFRISEEAMVLGNYNNTTTCTKNNVFWFKISYSGILISCVMTFDVADVVEQVSTTDPNIKNGSPFYIRGLNPGTVTVTATVTVGYSSTSQTIQITITVP